MIDSDSNLAGLELDIASFELEPGTTLIEASAGTGKTFTIQYIVLDLLLKGLSLSEILVVTFTEAATQELSDRMQSFLFDVHQSLLHEEFKDPSQATVLERACDRIGQEQVRRIIRKALSEVDQAAIYTIHGFCMRALQDNAFAADASFDVELTADVSPLVEELVMDYLRRLHLTLPVCPPREVNLNNLSSRALKLTSMLRVKDPYADELSSLGQSLRLASTRLSSYASEKDSIIEEFLSYEGQLNGNSYRSVYFSNFESLLSTVLNDPLSVDGKVLQKLSSGAIQKAFKKAHKGQALRSGFFAACGDLKEAQSEFLSKLMKHFDTWFIQAFQQLKRDRGIMSYDDMILDLDRALHRSTQLKEQLKAKYRAALVDEFQDTDSRQYRIFQNLFHEGRSNGRFFAMIGDPKQSIYAFRGADVQTYLKARERADRHYTLPMNYRSAAKMVDGVNHFFEGSNLGSALGADSNAIGFEPVTARGDTKEVLCFADGFDVERFYERALPFPDDGKVNTAQSKCIPQMAEDLKQLLDLSSAGYLFLESADPANPTRRAVRPDDVAVLVDTHQEAAAVQDALLERGIVAVRSKVGNIWETSEAEDFLYFLMACLNPTARIVNLLLVSPLYAKNDSELRQMSDAEFREVYEALTVWGNEWREGASVSRIWMKFFDQYSIRERLLSQVGGERVLTNYLHLAEFTQQLERVEGLSSERVIDRLHETIRNGVDSPSEEAHLVRLESDDQAVKIMTMHGAKGLEFPIVFLPSLWQSGIRKHAKEAETVQVAQGDPDCFVSLAQDPEEVIATQSAEKLRLGYVAMTRAVHFCVYYNVRDLPKQHGSSNQANGWFDQWLAAQRNGVYPTDSNDGFLFGLDQCETVDLDTDESEPILHERLFSREISSAYQITSYSSLTRLEEASHDADPSKRGGFDEFIAPDASQDPVNVTLGGESDLLLVDFPSGVRTGTCIHEILERCDFTHSGQWPGLVESIVERHFPDGSEPVLKRRIEQVLNVLNQLCGTTRLGWSGDSVDLSKLSPESCIPEMDFYFPIEQVDLSRLESILAQWGDRSGLSYEPTKYPKRSIEGFLTGSVDLFFTQDGRYTILDWKTNKPLHRGMLCRSSYDRNGMHEHMMHGRYYLQALIYSVATVAYLRQRLGDRFDWDTHIGGFIYCFVRGLDRETGWLHEAFSEEEVALAGEALGLHSLKGGGA